MKRILSLILLICAIAFGQNYVKIATAIAATDLTNINKSTYLIYSDIDNIDLSVAGQNLCIDNEFTKMVDKFTCTKPISYLISNINDADIIITNNGAKSENKLVVCTNAMDNCDVIIDKKILLNKDNMNKKGFVPEPGHKW